MLFRTLLQSFAIVLSHRQKNSKLATFNSYCKNSLVNIASCFLLQIYGLEVFLSFRRKLLSILLHFSYFLLFLTIQKSVPYRCRTCSDCRTPKKWVVTTQNFEAKWCQQVIRSKSNKKI